MFDDLMDRIFAEEWMLFLVVAAVLLTLTETGFRFGLRLHVAQDKARKAQIGGIQGAVLGLLGLLLGFTFSMAVNRYDQRRGLVVQEANTIGTTWLRTSLLPAAHQAPVRDLLRRYIEVRLSFQALANDPDKLAEGLRQSAALQAELWQHATAAATEAPTNITGTFIASLNETIDTEAERLAAGRAQIPGGVWLLLLIVAASGCFITSYGAGAEGARTLLGSVFLPLLFIVVIVLIFDFSHPRKGIITVSQQALHDLQQTMQSSQSTTNSTPP